MNTTPPRDGDQKLNSVGKPRRVERACERCRAKKIRCDSATPKCAACVTSGVRVECVYEIVRRRGRGKKHDYIRTLEKRVESLEAANQTLGLSRQQSIASSPDIATFRSCTPQENRGRSDDNIRKTTSVNTLSSTTDIQGSMNPQSTNCDPARNVFSKWIPERPGPLPVLQILELTNLLEVYLEDINPSFPIFHAHTLTEICRGGSLELCGSATDPARRAISHIIAATVIQSRATDRARQKVSEITWGYFRTAFEAFGEIVAMKPTMLSVQALLVMAKFLSKSADTRTALMLSSTAMKMIQVTGLDAEKHAVDVDNKGVEIRCCVVWAGFLLDASLSIQAGLPPSLHAADIELSLPNEDLVYDTGDSDPTQEPQPRHMFILQISLLIIYSRIKKLQRCRGLTPDTCQLLWIDLYAWYERMPTTIKLKAGIESYSASHNQTTLQLQLSFYNCVRLLLAASDSVPVQFTDLIIPGSQQDSPFDFSVSTVSNIARVTMLLIKALEEVQFDDIWTAMPTILSSTFYLMSGIYNKSNHAYAIEDVKLINSTMKILETLQKQGCEINDLILAYAKLLKIAKYLVLEEKFDLHSSVQYFLAKDSVDAIDYENFAQGLLSNLPTFDDDRFNILAINLFGPSKRFSRARLVPSYLIPTNSRLDGTTV